MSSGQKGSGSSLGSSKKLDSSFISPMRPSPGWSPRRKPERAVSGGPMHQLLEGSASPPDSHLHTHSSHHPLHNSNSHSLVSLINYSSDCRAQVGTMLSQCAVLWYLLCCAALRCTVLCCAVLCAALPSVQFPLSAVYSTSVIVQLCNCFSLTTAPPFQMCHCFNRLTSSTCSPFFFRSSPSHLFHRCNCFHSSWKVSKFKLPPVRKLYHTLLTFTRYQRPLQN